MSVNVDSRINRIFQEYSQTLLHAFDEAPSVSDEYAMEVPSSSRSTMHAWLGDQSQVREWVGKRVANSFGTRVWEIINRQWELTYEFDVNQINDDLEGLVAAAVMRARSNGAKWLRHKDRLCASTLEAGTTSLCFDGQNYHSTSHPVDVDGITAGTYRNYWPARPLTHANFNASLVQMHSYRLEDGSPMVPPGSPLKLIIDPSNRLQAEQILLVKSLTAAAAYGLLGTSGASDNTLVGKAEVVENAFLTLPGTWYLTAEVDGVMPIIFQRRQAVETLELGPGSQLYFDEKKVRIGTDARYEASYTFPQLCIRNDPS